MKQRYIVRLLLSVFVALSSAPIMAGITNGRFDLPAEDLEATRAVCPVPCVNGIRQIVTDISDCLCVIDSKIDNIDIVFSGTVIVDLGPTFTVLQQIINNLESCCDSLTTDFNETWTILGGINSRLDNLSCSGSSTCDLSGTFTVLNAVQNQLASCCDSLTADFNETWTILGGINSRLDNLSCSGSSTCDLSGTFTVLNAVQNQLASCCDSLTADFNETWTILGGINSRLDNLSCSGSSTCDLSGTFTVLNAVQNQLASCCDSLTADFNETWTILGGINSRLDNLSCSGSSTCDLSGTFTVLNAVQNQLASCCDSLTADFNETWTILGGINSRLDNLSCSGSSTCDLSGTFTVLNALQNQLASCCDSLTADFKETWTILGAIAGCAANVVLIHQSDVPYTITKSGVYCVVENLTGPAAALITIAASNVVLDLNDKNLSSATVGVSAGFQSNITIKNGFLFSMGTGISLTGLTHVWLSNCKVFSVVTAAFDCISLNNLVIENCYANNNLGTTPAGFNLSGCLNFMVLNSHAAFNTTANFSGFNIASSQSGVLKCCTADNNTGTSGDCQGFNVTSSRNIRFDYCGANSNRSSAGIGSGFVIQSLATDIDCYNCQANSNSGTTNGYGFRLADLTRALFELCFASNNGFGFPASTNAFGFGVEGSSSLCKFHQCTAEANTGTALAAGFAFANSTSSCDVRNNTALGHIGATTSVGFRDLTAGTNLIYANFACNNTVNYLIPVGFPVKNPNIAEEYDNVDCTATPTAPTTRDAVLSCCDLMVSDFNQTWTILGGLSSKIDNLSVNVSVTGNFFCDLGGTFTVLNAIEGQIASCCDSLTADFNETWTILGAINSKLDNLSFSGSSTCDLSGTFTVLNSIQNQLASCCDSLSTDFKETWTILGALAGCGQKTVLIHQSDISSTTPYTITQPGSYCVVENLTGAGPATTMITISSSNVELDLNGKTLSTNALEGIVSAGTFSNISIKNGTISNMNDNGISLTNCSTIRISNVNTLSCASNGIFFQSGRLVLIEDCIARACAQGFQLSGSLGEISSFTIVNCKALECTTYGFRLGNVQDCYFKCCTATANHQYGFYLNASSANRFDYCIANLNGNTTTSPVFGFYATDSSENYFYNCEASRNSIVSITAGQSAHGFYADGTSSHNTYELCLAASNGVVNTPSAYGFRFLGTGVGTKIHNCTAVGNIGSITAGIGFSLEGTVNNFDLLNNMALSNSTIGIQDTSGMTHAIYANFSCFNGTNYSIPGTFPIKHPNIAEEYDNVSCSATPSTPTTRDAVLSCCDLMVSDFNQTWTLIGNVSQVSIDPATLNTMTLIDAANLSVIQWLKTIYRQTRGL